MQVLNVHEGFLGPEGFCRLDRESGARFVPLRNIADFGIAQNTPAIAIAVDDATTMRDLDQKIQPVVLEIFKKSGIDFKEAESIFSMPARTGERTADQASLLLLPVRSEMRETLRFVRRRIEAALMASKTA